MDGRVQLEAEAAFQAAAEAREPRRVQRQVLLLGHLDRDRVERLEPRAAAQRPATRAVARQQPRLVPDPDQASDAVQEAFFSAYRNLRSYRGPSFRGWLTRIAVNAAMDLQRARKRRPVSPYPELEDESWQPPAGPETDPEVITTASERGRALAAALAAIGADQRAAIILFDVEGYDYAEIARMTGVSLGTVKSRIHRGRLALRALLADRMELFRS